MAAASLFFMGQFALFTYLRPYLETIAHVDVSTLSLLLLVMGVAGFVGTLFIGILLEKRIYATLIVIPLSMAAIAVALIFSGASTALVAVLLALWGLLATSAPVGWWTWVAKSLPENAEAGGGLMVAVVQLAITAGATSGGVLFDTNGYRATFALSAALLVGGSFLALMTWRAGRSVAS
jgi:predicted MFS family arabinose efflux permease